MSVTIIITASIVSSVLVGILIKIIDVLYKKSKCRFVCEAANKTQSKLK